MNRAATSLQFIYNLGIDIWLYLCYNKYVRKRKNEVNEMKVKQTVYLTKEDREALAKVSELVTDIWDKVNDCKICVICCQIAEGIIDLLDSCGFEG
jgi:DNA-binding MarR family transcriptional regulator